MVITAAALKLVQDAKAGGDNEEQEIAVPPVPRERGAGPPERSFGPSGAGAPFPGGKKRPHPMRAKPGEGPPRQPRAQEWPVARLWIGAGRDAGIRPGDLVGAIANEAGLPSRAIGAVEIADRHSIVELPEEVIDDVAKVLSRAWIKGKKVSVRRDKA